MKKLIIIPIFLICLASFSQEINLNNNNIVIDGSSIGLDALKSNDSASISVSNPDLSSMFWFCDGVDKIGSINAYFATYKGFDFSAGNYYKSGVWYSSTIYRPLCFFENLEDGRFEFWSEPRGSIGDVVSWTTPILTIDSVGGISADNILVDNAIHLFMYFGDSAISVSYTTSWQHLTNAYNDMYVDSELDGFSISGDTITIEHTGDYDLKAKHAVAADNGKTVSIRFYNVTQTDGCPVAGAITGRIANNYMSLPVESYYSFTAGDKIVLQYKGDANGTLQLKNGIIKIYYIHE